MTHFTPKSRPSLRSDDKGSATMEFVIGLPLIVVAMIFIFEFSSLFWAHHIATYNVRSAVRFLSRAPLAEPFLTQAENIAKYGDPAATSGAYGWMKDVVVDVNEDFSDFTDDDFRVSGQVIRIHVNVPFPMPTFGTLNDFSGGDTPTTVTFSVIEEARYFGE